MSIWIRKKQAVKREEKEKKERMHRRPKPVLEALSLPEDAAGRSVRMVLTESRALIENHLGVSQIGREEIILTGREALAVVRGSRLQLEDVRPGSLAVTGSIRSVEFVRPVEGGGRT